MKKKIPISSYRLQLSQSFGFKEAIDLLPYLGELGVEMIYTSPYFEIVQHSHNSYMITSPLHIAKELGGETLFEEFCKSCKTHGLIHMMDIVPNHMAASRENPWWDDVIKNHEQSKYASFFDIDWKLGNGTVVLPGTVKNIHESINYRRFFDICEMVGLKMENQDLYELYFSKIFSYVEKGWIGGFRVDHIDGLKFPKQFLEKIHKKFPYLYVTLEKILTTNEGIHEGFICDGTVGYDVLNLLNQVMLDGRGENKLTLLYDKMKEEEVDLADIKIAYVNRYLISEMNRFSKAFGVDKEELLLFLAHFPIYRTYVDENVDEVDKKAIERAASFTKGTFFKTELLKPQHRQEWLKLQQILPAVFAKGVEDTFNYRYVRLTSLNEVGSDLTLFSISNDFFHRQVKHIFTHFPNTMHTLSTHDTKRSLDARMRIHILAEHVDEFAKHLSFLPEFESKKMRYFFFQTWVAMPEKHRLIPYMIKAAREGKYYSDHLQPNEDFERKMTGWIESVLNDEILMKKLAPFRKWVEKAAEKKSLASLVLQMGLFGVMDIYQGEELINANLVDPDNRRPVDFALRKKCLKDGSSLKMNILTKGLHFRKEHRDLILHGSYEPFETSEDCLGYKRCYQGKELIVVVRKFEYDDPIHIEKRTSIFPKKLPFHFSID